MASVESCWKWADHGFSSEMTIGDKLIMASALRWLLEINWSWLQFLKCLLGINAPVWVLKMIFWLTNSEKTRIEQQILNWFTNGSGRYLPLIGSLTKFLSCLKFLDEESLFASKIVYSNMVFLMQSSCKSFESKIIFEMMLLVYRKCITG